MKKSHIAIFVGEELNNSWTITSHAEILERYWKGVEARKQQGVKLRQSLLLLRDLNVALQTKVKLKLPSELVWKKVKTFCHS